jgi:prepilin-type N-terminal cleavage/methylation domain-containing protein
METRHKSGAFTLIELLVVISIIAVLAGIALPVFSSVQEKGAQTKALSNAKQIGLACKLYASDHNGQYPTRDYNVSSDEPGSVDAATSNEAFQALVPEYVQTESIFWLAQDKYFCDAAQAPDEEYNTDGNRLGKGENHWAYVLNLSDTSNPSFPLIADGMKDAVRHTYSEDELQPGGVWRGKRAIVIRADTSGAVEKLNRQFQVPGPGSLRELFETGSAAGRQWLDAEQKVVNPEPAS